VVDRLIFNLDDRLFGFDTKSVDKVVEMERVFFLPGSSGILSGIISLSGEPVTVVDARRAVGVKPLDPAPPEAAGAVAHRIIVLRDSDRLLGYDVGPTEVSFLWELDPAGKARPDGGEEEASPETPEARDVELIDWTVDYDKTLDILEGQDA
jgi:hypothetical protein